MKMAAKELLAHLDTERDKAQRALQALLGRYDYHEHGGAPLLGIDGICIIAHGSSKARAIRNALKAASQFARQGANEAIEAALAPAGEVRT